MANKGTAKPAAKRTTRTRAKKTSPDMRHQMIAEAAYYRAELRGFSGGDALQDWLDAEIEIDQLF